MGGGGAYTMAAVFYLLYTHTDSKCAAPLQSTVKSVRMSMYVYGAVAITDQNRHTVQLCQIISHAVGRQGTTTHRTVVGSTGQTSHERPHRAPPSSIVRTLRRRASWTSGTSVRDAASEGPISPHSAHTRWREGSGCQAVPARCVCQCVFKAPRT